MRAAPTAPLTTAPASSCPQAPAESWAGCAALLGTKIPQGSRAPRPRRTAWMPVRGLGCRGAGCPQRPLLFCQVLRPATSSCTEWRLNTQQSSNPVLQECCARRPGGACSTRSACLCQTPPNAAALARLAAQGTLPLGLQCAHVPAATLAYSTTVGRLSRRPPHRASRPALPCPQKRSYYGVSLDKEVPPICVEGSFCIADNVCTMVRRKRGDRESKQPWKLRRHPHSRRPEMSRFRWLAPSPPPPVPALQNPGDCGSAEGKPCCVFSNAVGKGARCPTKYQHRPVARQTTAPSRLPPLFCSHKSVMCRAGPLLSLPLQPAARPRDLPALPQQPSRGHCGRVPARVAALHARRACQRVSVCLLKPAIYHRVFFFLSQ